MPNAPKFPRIKIWVLLELPEPLELVKYCANMMITCISRVLTPTGLSKLKPAIYIAFRK